MEDDTDTIDGAIGSDPDVELADEVDEDEESEESEESSDDDTVGSNQVVAPPAVVQATIPSTPQRNDAVGDPSMETPVSSNKKKTKAAPTNVSIAHDYIISGNLVIFHTDLEVGGPHCGIIQIATVAYDVGTKSKLATFNEFISQSR